jgi:hypothetical protein
LCAFFFSCFFSIAKKKNQRFFFFHPQNGKINFALLPIFRSELNHFRYRDWNR